VIALACCSGTRTSPACVRIEDFESRDRMPFRRGREYVAGVVGSDVGRLRDHFFELLRRHATRGDVLAPK
jgi:hypothetical protein